MKNIYYAILLGFLIPIKFIFGAKVIGIKNPIGVDSIPELISVILSAVVAIGTPIAVLFLIFAGFKFVTAQGKPGEIDKAKEFLMWTIVGIVILLGAQLLAEIVKGTIEQLGSGIIN